MSSDGQAADKYNPFAGLPKPSAPEGYAGPDMPSEDDLSAGFEHTSEAPVGPVRNDSQASVLVDRESTYPSYGAIRNDSQASVFADRELPSAGSAGGSTSAPSDTFTFSSDAFQNVGGVRMINMEGFEPAPGKTYKDYTLLTEKKADGTVSYKTVLVPEGDAGKGMNRILTFDESTGQATYGKPTAEEPTTLQSLYKSPQFMAPVVSSVLNGLAQSFIAERMAKAQRDEQRRMLDAQFQLANAKEEADMAERRRVSKRYWELKKKQGYA